MKPLRILIADDHDLMRRGVKTLLESHPGWEVCGEAKTGYEAVTKTTELKPDLVILDISMPGLNGVEAAREIRQASASTEILILSLHYSDQLIRDIVDAGARGYVLKSDADRDVIIAVEALANHKPFFTHHATELILANFNLGGTVKEVPELCPTFEDKITEPVNSRLCNQPCATHLRFCAFRQVRLSWKKSDSVDGRGGLVLLDSKLL